MTKTLWILGIVALLGAGFAFAYGWQGYGMMGQTNTPFAANSETTGTQLRQIMQTGTYTDLQALREQIGYDVMPMIEDEQDFAFMQEHHKQVQTSAGRRGGCPMMDNDGDE